jgi:hypothetical protein
MTTLDTEEDRTAQATGAEKPKPGKKARVAPKRAHVAPKKAKTPTKAKVTAPVCPEGCCNKTNREVRNQSHGSPSWTRFELWPLKTRCG